MKKICHENINQKKAEVAILISDKVDFKANTITRDRGGYHIMIKGSTYQEDIAILSMYAPNNRSIKSMKQQLTGLRGETGKFSYSWRLHYVFQQGLDNQTENQ